MTDWQKCYESGETPWDRGAPAPGLVEFLKTSTLTGRILVPGCGFGRDIEPLAALPNVEVVGLDIAEGAVTAAQKRLQSLKNVEVAKRDLFQIGTTPMAGIFDWVWEHTCFCAIDRSRRPDYVQSVAAALKPGGGLLAVFYLNPWDPEDGSPAQGPPFGVTEAELDALFGNHFHTQNSWRPGAAYPGREGRELMRLLRRKL